MFLSLAKQGIKTVTMKNICSVLLILVSLSLVIGCNQSSEQGPMSAQAQGEGRGNWGKPEKPKFKIPVTVERVERGRMYAYLQAVGSVVPVKEIEIKPEMTGRIYYTRRWMEGDDIKKGEVFATIDDRQVRLDINESELQLEIAKAAVRPASAQLEQAIKDEQFKATMYERGAISKAEYDLATLTRIQRENQYQQALKEIDSRQMALDKLKQELEKVEIIMPFDGVLLPSTQSISTANSSSEGNVTDLTMMNGQMVGSSSVLCRLANIDKVHVALDVPAKDLIEVQVGQDVELEIYSRSGNDYKGTVADISTSLNSSTRTYTVNVLVDNPNHELRPGMFAKARIITKEKLDAVSIPRSMIQLRNNRNVVFVVVPKIMDEIYGATDTIDLPDTEALPLAERNPRQLVMAGKTDQASFATDHPNRAGAGQIPTKEELETMEWIAEERVIEKGIENREKVEVVSGLMEGDLLVVLGYETLTDGVNVNVNIREEDPLALTSLP